MRKRLWYKLSCAVGGVYEIGRLWIILHDHGLSIAWRQIEIVDWRS